MSEMAKIELLHALRTHRENVAVLDVIQEASAHGDLAEVLAWYAQRAGEMRVLAVSDADYPALFATVQGSDVIVLAASGMRKLMVRSGGRPDGSQLGSEPAPELGSGWWRLDPFDPDVTKAETTKELERWFALASVMGAPGRSGG